MDIRNVLAGVLATNDVTGRVWEDIKADRHDAGAVIGPFEAWLLVRGMRTLPLLAKQMSCNAMELAEFLQNHPKIEKVLYPGLASHTGHELATRQMSGGFGSLLSCIVKGGGAAALEVVGKLEVVPSRNVFGRGRKPCRTPPHDRTPHRDSRRVAAFIGGGLKISKI